MRYKKQKNELSPEESVAFFALPSVSIRRDFIGALHMVLVIDAQQCYDQTVESSDGRNLMPELSQNADPAVTA